MSQRDRMLKGIDKVIAEEGLDIAEANLRGMTAVVCALAKLIDRGTKPVDAMHTLVDVVIEIAAHVGKIREDVKSDRDA